MDMNFNEKEAQLIKLAIDETKGVPVENFSSEDRNEKIRERFAEILGTRKPNPMQYEKHKHEIFALISEVINETIANGGADIAKFNSQFVEEDTIDYGDKKEYEVKNKSYLSVGKISGNNWELDRQRLDAGEKFEVKTDAYYISVYDYFMRFLAGKSNWTDLMDAVSDAVLRHKRDFITNQFTKALDGIPALYKYSGTYNESQILETISHVSAANEGTPLSLVGTKEALAKLQKIDTSALSDRQKEEANENGFLGKWKGYNCVSLPTVYKEGTTEFAFNPTHIYILPSTDNKPIKIVNEGQVMVMEINSMTETIDMTKQFGVIWRMGGAIVFNRVMGDIQITG